MAVKSGGGAPSAPQEFDKEIKDMAEYIHHYKIDSDLAVREQQPQGYVCKRH
jgi:2-methylcitrate dehydratase